MNDQAEREHGTQNSGIRIGVILVFALGCWGAYYFLAGGGWGRGQNLYTCENNLKISGCGNSSGIYGCNFTNTYDRAVSLQSFRVWQYDNQGVQQGHPFMVGYSVIQSGGSVRESIQLSDNTSKIVFCSEDPSAPHLKDSIKKVE
jgi:hypothetical protein